MEKFEVKRNRKITKRNRLDLAALGSWPIMPKFSPDTDRNIETVKNLVQTRRRANFSCEKTHKQGESDGNHPQFAVPKDKTMIVRQEDSTYKRTIEGVQIVNSVNNNATSKHRLFDVVGDPNNAELLSF